MCLTNGITWTGLIAMLVGLGPRAAWAGAGLPLPSTLEDFFLPGTQPDPGGTELAVIEPSGNCSGCHGGFVVFALPLDAEPYRNWAGSMMAQAGRDPIFHACLTIANQDAADSGDLCIRCHSPAGWLGGRSTPTDGSALVAGTADFDGVNCHFCHRLVDPVYQAGVSPIEDQAILDDLAGGGLLPGLPGNGQYVLDPEDVRRGPSDPADPNDTWPYNPHNPDPVIISPFHKKAELCATCHDVSNPMFVRQPNGNYAADTFDQAHPTLDKYDMFPIERTYSEWSASAFADGGVQLGGRFGGNHPTGVMATCQDCHLPDAVGPGCRVPGFPELDHMPQHALNGGNTWVLRAVRALYPDAETGLSDDILADAQSRVTGMLENASDLELSQVGNRLNVRVVNFSGHKLPSGYPEGRRMWVNLAFRDGEGVLVAERGAYDFSEADLTTTDTKVYETRLGLDAEMAAISGLPAGESFHFVLNNSILKDNRIPPIGFNNAAFEAIQAQPVAYTYADGQYWDDTEYSIPMGAVEATVRVYYQSTSKEYIEFLRDENHTNDRGQVAYDQWVLHGKSAPVVMDESTFAFAAFEPADLNNNGVVNAADLAVLLGSWGPCSACAPDINGDGTVNAADLAILLGAWS